MVLAQGGHGLVSKPRIEERRPTPTTLPPLLCRQHYLAYKALYPSLKAGFHARAQQPGAAAALAAAGGSKGQVQTRGVQGGSEDRGG